MPSPSAECLSSLPGDPGLVLFTNVDMGAQKMDTMKKLSGIVAASTGKPEGFVTVCICVRPCLWPLLLPVALRISEQVLR